MQNRSKILILLFTATIMVGSLTLWHSTNYSDAVVQFRSLFSGSSLHDLQYLLPSITDRSSLLYGGISLFSVIMILLVLKAAWRDDSRRSKERSR
jgi:TRAP-type C4-dicarboxylate transport system permease small subunit